MGLEDALPSRCPCCEGFDQITRAADVRQDATEAANGSVDVALPDYEMWSTLLVVAIGLLLLSAMATSAANSIPYVGLGIILMPIAFVLGVIGLMRTRRNLARMRSVEPLVRRFHEHALYCGNCARMHFETRELPPGLKPGIAWTVPDYRKELWSACGFAKTRRHR